MMTITKKEKAKEPPGTRQAGKGFEKMKILPMSAEVPKRSQQPAENAGITLNCVSHHK
ncbi:hypothetical protein [Klebsiella pneumoniae]|uniref:hypothetical protein n=1 Tax=Klebsiella pneumoniae TaxID=573 RepID=UPI00186B520F|nr:hypothetical protein [Klebsiella pneumoniae]